MHTFRRRWPIAVFAAWSGFIWVTRIMNAWAPTSEESSTAKLVSTATAVVLLAGAVAAVVVLVRAWSRSFGATEALVLRLLAGATIAVWAVRIPLIVLDGDHNVAFKVVHAMLGALSIALAALTWWRAGTESTDSTDRAVDASSSSSTPPAVSPAGNVGR